MKLVFHLLVVDDQPDAVGGAIGNLKVHLDQKGFDLALVEPPALSGPAWEDFLKQNQSYDLVMVDYNLSQPEMGDVAANRLRAALPYTDIVFYSAEPRVKLLEYLAKQQVEGVFASQRDELANRLAGLADAVIGKAMDLNHMRGITMAEVAEVDILMEELLVSVFQLDHPDVSTVAKKIVKNLENNTKKRSRELCRNLEENGLSVVISDGRIFSHQQKSTALQKLAELLPDAHQASNLKVLKSLQNKITAIRNHLAHGKEDSDNKGNIVLRSIRSGGSPLITDEKWMVATRRKLRKHRETLETLCSALRKHFGLAESTDDPDKDEP